MFFLMMIFFIPINVFNIIGCLILQFKQELSLKIYFFWMVSASFSIFYAFFIIFDVNMIVLNSTFLIIDSIGLKKHKGSDNYRKTQSKNPKR